MWPTALRSRTPAWVNRVTGSPRVGDLEAMSVDSTGLPARRLGDGRVTTGNGRRPTAGGRMFTDLPMIVG
jgi:hypothetical protein